MSRKKVKLAWIPNNTARKVTFKKRKKGLLKKVSELSTLCDVDACAIVYGHNDPQPEVWPSNSDAHRVLTRFKSMPEQEQTRKMMNEETFMKQRIRKAREQLKKQQRENHEYELNEKINQSLMGKELEQDLGPRDLDSMEWMIQERMKTVEERIIAKRREMSGPSKLMPAPNPMETVVKYEFVEAMQRHPWHMETMNAAHEQQQQQQQAQHHQQQQMPFGYYGGEELPSVPYGGNAAWSNVLFHGQM